MPKTRPATVPGFVMSEVTAVASSYTDEQRAQALAMLRDGVGTQETARRTGIPASNLSRWAKDAGIESPNAEQTAAAHEAVKVAWAQRRTQLVDRFGAVIEQLLDRIEADDADPRGNAVAVGIFVDKAQLLSGGVTSRHEQLDAQRRRERVEALAQEADRRLHVVPDPDDEAATGS